MDGLSCLEVNKGTCPIWLGPGRSDLLLDKQRITTVLSSGMKGSEKTQIGLGVRTAGTLLVANRHG